jgi:hypothetical protein
MHPIVMPRDRMRQRGRAVLSYPPVVNKAAPPLRTMLRAALARILPRRDAGRPTTAARETPDPRATEAAIVAAPTQGPAPRVAVFVDMENVPAGFIEPLADLADTFGRVCHFAVYADWRQPGNRGAWGTTLDLGGVPKQIMKTGGGNSADITMVVDAMEVLLLAPGVDVYVLASGDSDFVPLIQRLRGRGKLVVGAAPAGRAIRPEHEAAFDRFERLRAPGDEPAAGKARSAPQPARGRGSGAPLLETTRKVLVSALTREGSMNAGELGQLLRDALPGFDQRALGYRRLSDLLRAQSDILHVRADSEVLHVSLVAPPPKAAAQSAAASPGGTAATGTPAGETPPAAASKPRPALERGDWTRLRDHLLAVLLATDAGFTSQLGDAELRVAMDALAKRSGEGELPDARVADVVSHYPSCFVRGDDGSIAPLMGLADAYRLRLGRVWEPVPRDAMRRGLALLPGVLAAGEPFVVAELPERLAAAANGDLTQAQARGVVNLLRKTDAWVALPLEPSGRLQARAREWVTQPPVAEARLDEAALARMGPFLPVDPAAMAAALGITE